MLFWPPEKNILFLCQVRLETASEKFEDSSKQDPMCNVDVAGSFVMGYFPKLSKLRFSSNTSVFAGICSN